MQRDASVTRRQVLKATGGALAVGTLGIQPAFGQTGCNGVPLEPEPDTIPEIDLRNDEPSAHDVPDESELLVYVYGYTTPPVYGRRLAATFEKALAENGSELPVVLAQWRARPENEAENQQEEAENFAEVEANADADGEKLARWLESNAGDRTVRIVGYSLGTRVALRALTELDGDSVELDTVSLLGPSVPASKVCSNGDGFDLSAARAVFSYHSGNDQVICDSYTGYLQLFADPNPPALGCEGAVCDDAPPENLVARNVTDTIGDHCAYGFPEVGVVGQVVEDFEVAPTDVETGDEDSEEDEQDGSDTESDDGETEQDTTDEGATPTDTATETTDKSEETAEETDTGAEDDTGDGEEADGDGAGMGFVSALSGLGGLGYLLSRRLSDK
jgi:hypothetical protein